MDRDYWKMIPGTPGIARLKLKKKKKQYVELLIPTLNKSNNYQFLLVLLEGTNHEQLL